MDTREIRSRRNPAETSNFLTSLVFGWTSPIFWKGAKRDLQITDLYAPLKSDESELLGDRLEREWKKELMKVNQELTSKNSQYKKPKRQPSLAWAITRMFWVPYMLQGLLLLVQTTGLQIMQPKLQGWIISYFKPGEKLMTSNDVLLYAGLLIIATLSVIFINHHTMLRRQRIGMSTRVACCSMIYRKILRLNQAAANTTAAGQVANLISNDVARFDEVPIFLHYIWIMPIQTTVIGFMLWQTVGVAALVGMGVMLLQTIPLQGYVSSLCAKLRSKIAVRTDERVQLMSELISGIQVLKMYSWEKPFELVVSKVRAVEVKFIGYMSYLRGLDLSIISVSEKVSLYFTLITYVLMGNSLTEEITFTVLSLYFLLQETCSIHFPMAIITAGEANISLDRITKFLLEAEVECSEKDESIDGNGLLNVEKTPSSQQMNHQVGIETIDITANWVPNQLPPTLSKVSLNITSQSLCALVGPVGSGKSSFLHLVLGELPIQSGQLSLFTDETNETKITSGNIRLSYASQDPWLFSASIRDNILFGQPYEERRYQEVTRVCALLEDFKQLPQGDLSFVGERGAALSGGQKARVNLARAVYRDADLYLFDDPLSAVDPRVGRHLFEECITGFLKGKTRILVTHQLQYLRHTDHVVVLNRGTVELQGTYEELATSISHTLDSEESEGVESSEKYDVELKCKTSAMNTDDKGQVRKVTENIEVSPDIDDEEMATGDISSKIYWEYFLAGGNMCSLAFLAIVFITGQIVASGNDYWVTYWTIEEAHRADLQLTKSVHGDRTHSNDTKGDLQEIQYARESRFFDENGLLYQNFGIFVYTVCLIGSIFLITLRSMLFTRMCINASRNIHNSMFSNLLQTTMRFFNINPSGRILNRFTKDMGTIDELLPRTMLLALEVCTLVIGIFILVILANTWMIIPAIAVCGLVYIIRSYYLKTAQDVKRLEGVTKSPMFSHISSTLNGLTTIRSGGAAVEELLRKEFDNHQDVHTGAWYLSIAIATAFGFVLDIILCCFIACICFSFILNDAGDTLGGFVGMAISQSFILTGSVEYGVRQSTELISQMTSVERILQYTKLPKERPLITENPPPPTWPSAGGLIFKNVTMRYADNEPPVLKNLNLTIQPGWKVGVIGRTGAGKSSLISALFRLADDGLEGEIELDGIDTKSIGLHELRPRISIIPQEPILFSASLRYNLDPFEQCSDAELWDSLREVELGDVVTSLDFQVAGSGANFSVGQRQLICLARAILRNNRLLVLDEATANVDHGTDNLIQNTIRRRFADCTVLTIAHRLNTIMDSDRVLVMMDGCIVEFGHPHLLLKDRDGHLSRMLEQTGKMMYEKLAGVAESAYSLYPEFLEQLNDSTVTETNDQITDM